MIEFGHLSHVGLRRELNEDTYYANADLGLWLVADGMGGHEFGEVASALAREVIVAKVREGESLETAIRSADEEIIRHSRQRREALPMGTTVAAVRIQDGRFEVAWVGDSRAYVWNGQLCQLSQDHSYVQELVERGAITAEQARSHPHRNVVTQALGVTGTDGYAAVAASSSSSSAAAADSRASYSVRISSSSSASRSSPAPPSASCARSCSSASSRSSEFWIQASFAVVIRVRCPRFGRST